jgi:hypothetical protein
MKTTKLLVLLGSLLPGALMPFAAQATFTTTTQTPVYDPTAFNNAGGYTFNNLFLPGGTSIGSAALELDVPLSTSITLTSVGAGYNYSFGMAGLAPEVPNSGEAFSFYIQLLNNGTAITPDFSTLIANPYTFGFTENNPFNFAVDNLYVSTSTGALASSLTFNEIAIEVLNNSQDEATTSFSVSLGVNQPAVAPVPEPTTVLAGALMLLPFGASALRGLRRKQAA